MADKVLDPISTNSPTRLREDDLHSQKSGVSTDLLSGVADAVHVEKPQLLQKEREKKEEGEGGEEATREMDRPFRGCLVLSFSFFAVFTGFVAIQDLQTSLNQADGLGITSLACLYGTLIVSGFFAPVFIQMVGAKVSVVVTWVCHLLYTLSNFHPTWGTLIPSSLLLGWVSAPLWTSQGLYLSAMGSSYARSQGLGLHAALSRLNGVFFTLFACTQITGNLISSLLLTRGAQTNATNAHCGASVCPILSADNSSNIVLIKPDNELVYELMGTFVACQVLGLVLTVVWLPPLHQGMIARGRGLREAGQTCVACSKALTQPRLLLLVPSFTAQAMKAGIILTEYTESYVSCTVGISKVGFTMATFGGFSAFSALLLGRLAKYTGRVPLYVTASLIDMGCLLTLLLWTPTASDFRFLFLLPALGGVSDGITQTQNNSLIAMVFPHNKAQSFAVYHTFKAAAFTFIFITGIFLCVATRLYLAIALYGLGFLGYLLVECLAYRDRRAQDEDAPSDP